MTECSLRVSELLVFIAHVTKLGVPPLFFRVRVRGYLTNGGSFCVVKRSAGNTRLASFATSMR